MDWKWKDGKEMGCKGQEREERQVYAAPTPLPMDFGK